MDPVYLVSSSAIHPQPQRLQAPLCPLQQGGMYCVEPDYSPYIPPAQLRRMSRVLRMGVYAGMDCLQQAGIRQPDGIITGTGKGSMTDTEKFVKELKIYEEEALNPTPFILSTYNAINGALALNTAATGYNQTFVHRGSSLEWSLYDAQLQLQETGVRNLLVGSFDELTPEYYFIKDKIGYWKKNFDSKRALWDQEELLGTIGGEGAAFFLLSNEPKQATLRLRQVSSRNEPADPLQVVANLLEKSNEPWSGIDLLVLGSNGDREDEGVYTCILGAFDDALPVMAFKHLCGEYETAGGFALWMLHQWSQGMDLPDSVWWRQGAKQEKPKKILYYNHYRGINHNVLLLEVMGNRQA